MAISNTNSTSSTLTDPYAYSDQALAEILFERLERLRLEQNISQTDLADEIGITAKTYRNIASGNTKLQVLIAALRALHQLHHLDSFIPDELISPIQMAALKGKTRKHAYKKTENSKQDSQMNKVDEEEHDW